MFDSWSRCDFNTPDQAEQAQLHSDLQLHIRAGVGVQNIRHRTFGTVARTPVHRLRILFDKAALLDVPPAIEVFVVMAAFFAGEGVRMGFYIWSQSLYFDYFSFTDCDKDKLTMRYFRGRVNQFLARCWQAVKRAILHDAAVGQRF